MFTFNPCLKISLLGHTLSSYSGDVYLYNMYTGMYNKLLLYTPKLVMCNLNNYILNMTHPSELKTDTIIYFSNFNCELFAHDPNVTFWNFC